MPRKIKSTRSKSHPKKLAKKPAKKPAKKLKKLKKLKNQPGNTLKTWKPGSEPGKAGKVSAKRDFGAPAGGDSSRGDRDYVSRNTKRSDRGASQPYAWEHDGRRDHGAGAPDAGPGSASGGDVDTDIIGVGFGGSGLAASGPGNMQKDESDGSANEFNSPVPKLKGKTARIEPGTGRQPPRDTGVGGRGGHGSFVQPPDASTTDDAQGADAATNPRARDDESLDDSFAAEISTDDATGRGDSTGPDDGETSG